MKRPTICDNFDDSFYSTESGDKTTEVTNQDKNIFIIDKTENEGIFDMNYDKHWEYPQGKKSLTDQMNDIVRYKAILQKNNEMTKVQKRPREPTSNKLLHRIENYSMQSSEYHPTFEERVRRRQRKSLSMLKSYSENRTVRNTSSCKKSKIMPKMRRLRNKHSKSVIQNHLSNKSITKRTEGSTDGDTRSVSKMRSTEILYSFDLYYQH